MKDEIDQLVGEDGNQLSFLKTNEASVAERKKSVCTNLRQAMLDQRINIELLLHDNDLSKRCLANTTTTTTQSDIPEQVIMLHKIDRPTENPKNKRVKDQQQIAKRCDNVDEHEEEMIRSKLETAHKRTNALIMIDCLIKKRNELRLIDDKLHKMIAECLEDFDVSRTSSPDTSTPINCTSSSIFYEPTSEPASSSMLHNNKIYHLFSSHKTDSRCADLPAADQQMPGSQVALANLEGALDLSKLASDRSSISSLMSSWFPRSLKILDENKQIGRSTDCEPQLCTPQSARADGNSSRCSPSASGGPLNEVADNAISGKAAHTVNLKKSRLLGAVIPTTTTTTITSPIDQQQNTVPIKRQYHNYHHHERRSASLSSTTAAQSPIMDNNSNTPALDRQLVAPFSLTSITEDRYADMQAGSTTSTAEIMMMMMMMTPTVSSSTSSDQACKLQEQEQQQHHYRYINQQLNDFLHKNGHYKHSNATSLNRSMDTDLNAISQISQPQKTPEYHDCSARCLSSKPTMIDAIEEEILFRPVKRLCCESPSADERLEVTMTTANHYTVAKPKHDNRNEIVDLELIKRQQNHHRRAAISEHADLPFQTTTLPSINTQSDRDDRHVGLADSVDLRLRVLNQAYSNDNGRYLSGADLELPADKAADYIFISMQHNNNNNNNKLHQQHDHQTLLQSSTQTNMTTQNPPLQTRGDTIGFARVPLTKGQYDGQEQFALLSGPSSSSSGQQQRQHLDDVQKMAFRCHVCGSGFEDRHRLQQHLSIHLNLHPSWFEEKTIKETLAQYESKRGDYLCSICSVRFETTAEFDKHMQLHGDKPHRCDLCSHENKLVCFRYYRQLLTHLRSHCFLYSCRFMPDCKQTSNRKDYLKLHILKHHLDNKLPEQYTICCH